MKKFKRIFALVLCAAMLLSLAACGKKEEEKKEDTPEFVYASTYTTLSEGSESYFNPRAFTDKGFYSTVYEKVGEKIPEGAVPQYEGEFDVYEYRIYFVDSSGKSTRLEGYKPMAAKENTEGFKEFHSSADLSTLHINSDGNLVVIENVYASWLEGDVDTSSPNYWENYKYEQNYYIRLLNPDGSEISSALIPTEPEEYIYAYASSLKTRAMW